jgi:hypothetical protein
VIVAHKLQIDCSGLDLPIGEAERKAAIDHLAASLEQRVTGRAGLEGLSLLLHRAHDYGTSEPLTKVSFAVVGPLEALRLMFRWVFQDGALTLLLAVAGIAAPVEARVPYVIPSAILHLVGDFLYAILNEALVTTTELLGAGHDRCRALVRALVNIGSLQPHQPTREIGRLVALAAVGVGILGVGAAAAHAAAAGDILPPAFPSRAILATVKLGCSWNESRPLLFTAAAGSVGKLFDWAVEKATDSRTVAAAATIAAAGAVSAFASSEWALAFVDARRGCVEVVFAFVSADDALTGAVLDIVQGGPVQGSQKVRDRARHN